MKLIDSDKQLLSELCAQFHVDMEKILALLATVREYELKERRVGVYEALREIMERDLERA